MNRKCPWCGKGPLQKVVVDAEDEGQAWRDVVTATNKYGESAIVSLLKEAGRYSKDLIIGFEGKQIAKDIIKKWRKEAGKE